MPLSFIVFKCIEENNEFSRNQMTVTRDETYIELYVIFEVKYQDAAYAWKGSDVCIPGFLPGFTSRAEVGNLLVERYHILAVTAFNGLRGTL